MNKSRANHDLHELRRELDTIRLDEPKAPVEQHVEMLRAVLQMDIAGSFLFDVTGALDSFAFVGMSSSATEEYRRGVSVKTTWGFFEPWAIPSSQQNRVVICQARRFLEGSPAMLRELGLSRRHYRRIQPEFATQNHSFYERHQFHALWNLRCVMSDGPRLTGWIGGLAENRPTRDQRRRLEFLLPSILRRAALVRHSAGGAQTQAVIEALLAQVARPAYLVAVSGRIVHANRTGIAALEVAGCAERVRAASLRREDQDFDVTELTGRGVPAMALVIERARRAGVPDLARFGLTTRQTAVATHLCAGLSNHAIAGELDISERTVEVHLTAIYDRLGVDQRAAAIARLLGSV